mmetsp:Transcript_8228/g.17981  ORF Transcript_8228/g.17981 Transcript_8228/m.17981 type:complete len:838 (-) Transcript_8228:377-2890(-)
MRLLSVTLAASVLHAVDAGACLPSTSSTQLGAGRTIILEQNEWWGHRVSTQTAAVLLRDALGFNVSVRHITMTWDEDQENPLERLEKGTVDANVEGWRTDWSQPRLQDATSRGAISLSQHEFEGRVGLYVSRQVVDDHLSLFADYWRSYQTEDVLSLLPSNQTLLAQQALAWKDNCPEEFGCESGTGKWSPPQCTGENAAFCVPLYHVSPQNANGWVEQLITNLNLNFSVYYTGADFYSTVGGRTARGEPSLFYSYRPHEFLAGNNYVRITFPEQSQQCLKKDTNDRFGGRDCDQEGEPVYKVQRAGLSSYSLAASKFIESFSLRLQDQHEMMRSLAPAGYGGSFTDAEAACWWAQNNEDIWKEWIPEIPKPSCDEVLPNEIEKYPVSYHEELRACVRASLPPPCKVTGCGKFAECLDEGDETYCTCSSDDTQPTADFGVSRACEPTIASTDQQRIFWSLSMFLFGIGLLLTLFVLNEYLRNRVLKETVMSTFLSITIPDLVLSATYFVFHWINLLNGQEMAEGPCDAFAFLTTGAVYATFFGPPIVAACTLTVLLKAMGGYVGWVPSRVTLLSLMTLPWLVGFGIAIAAQAEGSLGSYRGLLCYNSEWDSFVTGGITIIVFFASTAVTIACYVVIAYFTWRAGRRSASAVAVANTFSVLRRGGALVATFFGTWALFIVAVIINTFHDPPPVTFEMVAALFVSAQPIIDAFVLLSTPTVRKEMLARLNQTYGDADYKSSTFRKQGGSSSSDDSNNSGSTSAGSASKDLDLVDPKNVRVTTRVRSSDTTTSDGPTPVRFRAHSVDSCSSTVAIAAPPPAKPPAKMPSSTVIVVASEDY